MIFPGEFLVWFGKDPERPWRVRAPSGRVFEARAVKTAGKSRTAMVDTGFDLPGGPRGVVVTESAWLEDARELIGP